MTNSKYFIKQLSIFSENKSGKLAAIAKIFHESQVNIHAFSIAEANSFGVVRAIVDKPDVAFAAFSKENYALQYTDVLGVKMADVPGGLFEVASTLGNIGINIEYAYAFRTGEFGTLIVKVSNSEEAVDKILAAGLELVPATDYNF
ncbi:ACT domain-containing protein [Methanorbis rubei]|uniref:ACT domain-containing protein n=1 Tax=Methanorbis rubei TaxID=3028300 RepID=A0AAE4MH76_9EURY|nr:hypothetical protein [Methanocorpusculaceae archaeon Cs1]